MLENIALIASGTWLLTAVIVGVAGRWHDFSGPDKQAVALLVALGFGAGGYLTGWLIGDPVELVLTVVLALFGANLVHDKLETPAREALDN